MFLNTTFAVTPAVTLRAGLRYTKDRVTVSNFYALEGLATGVGRFAPDAGTTWWTQTIGAQPATRSYFQTGLAPQGAVYPTSSRITTTSAAESASTGRRTRGAGLREHQPGYRACRLNGQAYNDPTELTREREADPRTNSG